MAAAPDRVVVSPYLQNWQMPNPFVLGGSTFPNQGSANPTPTILAFTYRTADAIVDWYLKRPGMLARA
jgi:gluconate 2-dehydrogenase alpha chain